MCGSRNTHDHDRRRAGDKSSSEKTGRGLLVAGGVVMLTLLAAGAAVAVDASSAGAVVRGVLRPEPCTGTGSLGGAGSVWLTAATGRSRCPSCLRP